VTAVLHLIFGKENGLMAKNTMMCPKCGDPMNCHAEKVDYAGALEDPAIASSDFGGLLQEVHACQGCGNIELRVAGAHGS
jgi:hypothetical protein